MQNTIETTPYVITYLFVLARVGSLIASAPFFSNKILPIKVKTILSLCIALTITSTIKTIHIDELISIDSLLLLVEQVIIGMTIGFIFQFIFHISLAGGHIIAMQSGLGFASLIDPSSQESLSVISSIYLTITLLIFLINNGHLYLISLIHKSFTLIPITMNSSLHLNFMDIVIYFGDIFAGALLIAFPAIIALIIANITLSVMIKSSPQLSMFTIGLPIILIIGLIVMILNFSSMATHVEQLLLSGQQQTLELLGQS